MPDDTQSIRQSARKFFSGTLLSRITGLARDIAMAAVFGVSAEAAAFLLAFRLAHLARRLFGEGALQTAFIPHFEEVRQKNPEKGVQFFCNLTTNIAFLLVLLITAIMAVLGGFLSFAELSSGNRQIASLTMMMMPSLLFICLYGLNLSFLQCEKHFFISSAAPVGFNLVWILTAIITRDVTSMALMINAACFVQWLATLPQTYASLKHYRISFQLNLKAIASFYAPFSLALVGVAAAQVNSAVDPLFARFADPEGPALLWYAIRLVQLPLALIGIAVSSAALPPLARAVENRHRDHYLRFFSYSFRKILYMMTPAALILFLFGRQIIELIYGHGDFGSAAIQKTTLCLWGYALGLIPSSLILIIAPAFYAQKNYRTPMKGSILSMTSNIFLNSIFILFLGWGPASVALSTSISAFLNLGYLMRGLNKSPIFIEA